VGGFPSYTKDLGSLGKHRNFLMMPTKFGHFGELMRFFPGCSKMFQEFGNFMMPDHFRQIIYECLYCPLIAGRL